jgi:hypothetical protein
MFSGKGTDEPSAGATVFQAAPGAIGVDHRLRPSRALRMKLWKGIENVGDSYIRF